MTIQGHSGSSVARSVEKAMMDYMPYSRPTFGLSLKASKI